MANHDITKVFVCGACFVFILGRINVALEEIRQDKTQETIVQECNQLAQQVKSIAPQEKQGAVAIYLASGCPGYVLRTYMVTPRNGR